MLRVESLDEEKQARYLALIDSAADELVELLDVLSLAARLENGRYDPVVREVDSLELAPVGATGTGATVRVEPDAVTGALRALHRAASRHGGVDVAVTVDAERITLEPVAAAAPIVLGESLKDLGAAVAVRLIRAIGGELVLEGQRLTVTLPT